MGQKANPISLRLKTTNKNFVSCWYSDIYYPDLITHELMVKEYINKLFTQIRYPNPSLSSSFLPKKTKTIAIYLNPLESRHRRCERFQLKFTPPARCPRSSIMKAGSLKTITSFTSGFGTTLIPRISQEKGIERAHNRKKNGREDFSLSFAEREKRSFIETLLLATAVHKRSRKVPSHLSQGGTEAAWKRDFQFLQKVNRLTWFHERKEAFLLLESRQLPVPMRNQSSIGNRTPLASISSPYNQSSIGNSKHRALGHTRGTFRSLVTKMGIHHHTSCVGSDESPAPSSCHLANRNRNHTYLIRLESILSKGLTSPTTLSFYKSIHGTQAAHFLSDEIAYYLERRVPFRRIKQLLLRELQTSYIVGVRVICSGRMGGRSKKAQRARREKFQWGQASSHVFSSKLSFASRSASTPLGKVGIKVWICYK